MSHKKDAGLIWVNTYTSVSKDLFSLRKQSVLFHLGFQCLPMCPFRGLQYTKRYRFTSNLYWRDVHISPCYFSDISSDDGTHIPTGTCVA